MTESAPPASYGRECLNAQLIRFSKMTDGIIEASRHLISEGLLLLTDHYGGLLKDADDVLSPAFERFEIELLKERFCQWSIFSAGEQEIFGYRSNFIDQILSDTGIVRDQLENLSRPEDVDHEIEHRDWARRYRRDTMEVLRSTAQRDFVNKEKFAEFEQFGLGSGMALNQAVRHIRTELDKILNTLGYERARKRYGEFNVIYTNARGVGRGAGLEIALDVSASPVTIFPMLLNMRFMPLFDIYGIEPMVVERIRRGYFFKMIEPIIPNFGLYRVALNLDQADLMLHAYKLFLPKVVPLLEAGCE